FGCDVRLVPVAKAVGLVGRNGNGGGWCPVYVTIGVGGNAGLQGGAAGVAGYWVSVRYGAGTSFSSVVVLFEAPAVWHGSIGGRSRGCNGHEVEADCFGVH